MTYNPKWLENSPDEQLGGFDGDTGLDTVVPTQKAVKSFIYDMQADVKDPSGIGNIANTSLTYETTSTPGQCTVSIAPDGEDVEVYLSGKKYVYDSAQTVTLPDVEGLHYVYFDASGTLVSTQVWNPNIILLWAFVSAVYWNATDNEVVYFGEERHGINMSGATHYNLHNSQGTIYLSGLALGDIIADSTSATNADAQISITQGEIMDEDIALTISNYAAPASIPMYYQSGTSDWRKSTASSYPLVTAGSGRMAWNELSGTWSLTEATDGYFVLTHIFATNDIDNPMIGVVGQAEYADIATARDAAETEISDIVTGELPFKEFVAVATIIYETDSTFANTPKSIIRSTNSGGDYQDWRTAALSPSAGSPADHGQLSGLGDDDHIQYAILSGIRAFTGEQEFTAGIDISGGEITVANNTTVDVGGTNVASFGSDSQQLGVAADTVISLTQSTDVIDLTVAGSSVGTFESDGLTLASGTNINEFSTDGTLADDSDNAVPTEAAVKTYVDTAIDGFSLNRIYQGNSQVIVNDATASGEIRVIADGAEVALFESTDQRIGLATAEYIILDGSSIQMLDGGNGDAQIFLADGDEAILGRGSANIYLDMANDAASVSIDNVTLASWTADEQIFGKAQVDGSGVTVDQNNTTVTVHASDQNYLVITDSTGGGTTTTTGTTLKYFDQAKELLKISTTEFVVGDLIDEENYFGMIEVNSDPDFLVATSTGTKIQANATFQRFGSYFTGHVQLASGETFPAAMYTDDNENIGVMANTTIQQLGHITQTRVAVNQTTDVIDFYSTTTNVGSFGATGLSLQNGTNINEFSTDGTLIGDSNDAVPTEQAVKTYVDNAIGGAVDHNSTTGLQGGDATSVEYYHLVSDVYSNLFATSATLAGLGNASSTNVEVDNTGNEVTIDANASEVASFTDAIQQIGVDGDTFVSVNQTTNTVAITAGNESQILVETTGTSIYDDLTVTGNLFVDGTTFVINNQEVTTSDNIIVVNNGEVGPGVTAGSAGIEVDRGSETNYQFLFVEASDTFRVGEVGSLQAVATREDSPGNQRVAWWNDTANRFDTLGNSYISVNTTADTVIVTANSATQATFDTNGLTLATGASVNEFSIDGTLVGDSNDAIPTEQAVKTYVDNAIGNISTRKISDGDSYVVVNDATGGVGDISIVVDGIEVGYYDAQSTSQRLGKTTGGHITTSDASVTATDNSVEIFSLTETEQIIGNASGSILSLSDTTAAIDIAEGIVFSAEASTTTIAAPDAVSTTQLEVTNAGNIFARNGGSLTVELNASAQRFGNGMRFESDGSSDANIITGSSTAVANWTSAGMTLENGTRIDEFSTDGTLSGDSDTAVPTEKAVKTYVDNAIGGVDTIRFVSSDTTAVAGDIVLVDSTAGPVSIELIESEDGRVTVKKITNDANAVTVTTVPGNIDGKASSIIDTPYQAYGYVSDGENFYII